MSVDKPIWYDYLVWDYSNEINPVPKGFKKDTPKEILKAYKKDIDEYKRLQEENPDARII